MDKQVATCQDLLNMINGDKNTSGQGYVCVCVCVRMCLYVCIMVYMCLWYNVIEWNLGSTVCLNKAKKFLALDPVRIVIPNSVAMLK
jgi:hypothetical protein